MSFEADALGSDFTAFVSVYTAMRLGAAAFATFLDGLFALSRAAHPAASPPQL